MKKISKELSKLAKLVGIDVHYGNLFRDVKANDSYVKVASQTDHTQHVMLSVEANQDMGASLTPCDYTIFIAEGKVAATVNGLPYALEEGDYLLIPQGSHHTMQTLDTPVKMFVVATRTV